MSEFLEFSQDKLITDSNGQIIYMIKIKPNYYGKYVLCILAGTVCSKPIFIKTFFPAAKIYVNQEPFFEKYLFPKGFPITQQLPVQPNVKILNSDNTPLQNVVVRKQNIFSIIKYIDN